MGGGAKAGTLDAVDPLRAPGIRGQLRFWWRALHAHEFSTRDELSAAEAMLWGGAADGSPVRSQVDLWVEALEKSAVDSSKIGDKDTYALWPARSTTAPRWKPGMRFRLHIRAPGDELGGQLKRSLCAWILFGGVGGRTRRGCGSLTLDRLAVDGDEVERQSWSPRTLTMQELQRLLGDKAFAKTDHAPNDTPSLWNAQLYSHDPRNAMDAWHTALGWLRDFRQDPAPSRRDIQKYAREPGKHKHPGRSNWPEPDRVRLLWDRNKNWAHAIRYKGQRPFWPRAGFGLPIKIKFKTPPDEPPDCELRWCDSNGQVHDRLASPLIVKPMAMADGRFVPIALWLYRDYPEGGQVGIYSNRNDHIEERTRANFDAQHGDDEKIFYEWLRKGGSIRKAFWGWLQGTSRAWELKP